MSTGIGRFNAKRAKINLMSKKAKERNEELGFTGDYFDRFEDRLGKDRHFPEIKKPRQELFTEQDRVEKLPFEIDGPVHLTFKP